MPDDEKSKGHGVPGKNQTKSESIVTRRKIRGHGGNGYWNRSHTRRRSEAVRHGKKKPSPKQTRKKEARRIEREEAAEKRRRGYPLTRADKKLLRILHHQDPLPPEEEEEVTV